MIIDHIRHTYTVNMKLDVKRDITTDIADIYMCLFFFFNVVLFFFAPVRDQNIAEGRWGHDINKS